MQSSRSTWIHHYNQFADWLLSWQNLSVKASFSFAVLLPFLFVFQFTGYRSFVSVQIFIAFVSLFLFLCVLSMTLSEKMKVQKSYAYIFAIVTTVLYLYLYVSILYWYYTSGRFDISFVLDHYKEVWPTLYKMVGGHRMMMYVCSFFILVFVFFLTFFHTFRFVGTWKMRTRITSSLCILFALLIAVSFPTYEIFFVNPLQKWNVRGEMFVSHVPIAHTEQLPTDNVIILQLESVSSFVTEGLIAKRENLPYVDPIPSVRSIATHGVFAPFFWSTAVLTNRAQEAILCGIVGNIQVAFSYRPQELPIKCLPSVLRDMQYRTMAFRSDDLSFSNTGKFMEATGFQEVHFTDIMQPEDELGYWGYDDCVFYDRIFEYLEKQKNESSPYFAYIEVSALNHYPFPSLPKYQDVYPYPHPANTLESYINSLRQQDYCVGKFYERYEKYTDGRTHLFITADTSWPISLHDHALNDKNAFNDNFLTFLTYIPPKSPTKPIVLDFIPAQTDLIATILDLLTDHSQQNSLVPFFQGKATSTDQLYEDCHILTQPYGMSKIVVIRGKDKYLYTIPEKTVVHYDIDADPFEQQPLSIEKNVSHEAFREHYYCDRFKT